jgi:hypothetical protein
METYRINSKHVRSQIRSHIVESVTNYDGENFTSFTEAKNHLCHEFDRVANYPHNLMKFPNGQKRFHDYLMGIPFGFEFADFQISQILELWGLNHERDLSPSLYTYLIYKEITN